MTDDGTDETSADTPAGAGEATHPAEQVEPDEPDRKPITELFGDNARVKLLDVFIATNQSALSASEVAELGGIDISTVRSSLDVFLENDVIEETGTVGYSPMYSLNDDSDVAEAIEGLSDALEDLAEEQHDPEQPHSWIEQTDESDGDDEGAGGAWSSR
jgi:DNA-binding transcriptional ArsR family regulator